MNVFNVTSDRIKASLLNYSISQNNLTDIKCLTSSVIEINEYDFKAQCQYESSLYVFIKVFELHACRICVYRVQILSLRHDERDYLQPLVHLNEVMSGEEGGALPLPSYTPLIRAGWGGQSPRPETQPPHNTLMDWLKVHLVKWLWLLSMMERSRVRDRGRGWQDNIQRGNKSEMMGKINNNCK